MNSYTFESPIQTFVRAALIDLVRKYDGLDGYSIVLGMKLRNGAYGAYEYEVDAQTGKLLTPDQAATLKRLVGRL